MMKKIHLISKENAKSLGLKKFFTGDPCLHGHVSERLVKNGCCVECAREADRKWRLANKEWKAQYYIDNKDRFLDRRRELTKSRYAENKERLLAENKKWRQENKERVSKNHKLWRKKNPEYKPKSPRKFYPRNKENDKKYYKKNYQKHLAQNAKRRAMKASAHGSYTEKDVERLKALQKFKCASCRKSIKKSCHVDHITPLKLGGSNEWTNLQILCPTCNLRKGAKDPYEWKRKQGMLL